jgi:hypothetical protein
MGTVARCNEGAKAGRGEGDDTVPYLETLDALSNIRDLARALEPYVRRVLEHWWDEVHRDQDISEVQADRPDPDLYFPGPWLLALGLPQLERIQNAGLRYL